MRFQVPQFIETEDKIVGPLSLKQFGYLAGAGAISLFLYFLVAAWLWFLLSLIAVGGGIALAFVKISGRPLIKILAAAAGFYWRPQLYLWQSENRVLPKTEEVLETEVGGRFSLESIIRGLALRAAWQQVELGSRVAKGVEIATKRAKERYEVFRGLGGEKRIARRVDYR